MTEIEKRGKRVCLQLCTTICVDIIRLKIGRKNKQKNDFLVTPVVSVVAVVV